MTRRCLIFMLIVLLPAVCLADGSDRAYEKARRSYYQLLDSQKDRLYRHNWLKVVDLFKQVYAQHPDGRRADDALFMAGKTSFELYGVSGLEDDARDAARYFDRVPELYPTSRLADDALGFSARIHETILGKPTPAYSRYRRIVTIYPDGDMKGRADAKLQELERFRPTASTGREPEPATAGPGNELRTIRFWSNPGYTRIVLEMHNEVDFTSNFLRGDDNGALARIYVDLDQTAPVENLALSQAVNDGLLTRIRTGQPDRGTTRVVLDLESFGDYKVFPLAEPFRIVIDVQGADQPELAQAENAITPVPDNRDDIAGLLREPQRERPLKVHIPDERAGRGLRRIVVDAGHGGRDPGAVGPSGVLEKTVTLQLARVLASKLEQDLNCEVILTRTGDTFLELEERTAIANKVGADLFISVHANANRSRRARGIETYYLNFSKNDKAVEVVARENGTSLKKVGDLELILLDLLANSKINESSRLAAEIQKAMVDNLKRHYHVKDLGVRQGPFYVLLGATMPSVLVEAAFISNYTEEKLLLNRTYQERAAAAITSGVRNYATALKLLAAK